MLAYEGLHHFFTAHILEETVHPFPIAINISPKLTIGHAWLFLDRTLVIAIRGTAAVRDLMINLRAYRVNAFGGIGKVHNGFYSRYVAIEDEIRTITTSFQHMYDGIVFTGHSMGGAVATIAGAIHSIHHPHVSVITFGSPKVGNTNFCDFFRRHVNRSIRIVHERDPVTQLPPFNGYHHVEAETFIIGLNQDGGLLKGISAHLLTTYLNIITSQMRV